jgi:ATP-dependent DNA helicase RecG
LDLEQLKALIVNGESETLEFKQTTNARSLAEAGKTLCGFLNSNGGVLLFGIMDNGKIIGQEVADKTKIEIAENILKEFNPYALIQVEYLDFGNSKQIICLATKDNTKPPYYYKNIAYRRSGTTTQIMPPSLLEELLEAKKWSARSWETMPAIGFTIEDLDFNEINNTVSIGIRQQKIPPNTDPTNILDALLKFGLIDSNKQINNAAIVLFAKTSSFKYAQCLLRLARFRGKDKQEFIDNQQVHGNAFKILYAVENFCQRHLPVASRFIGKMERIDEPFMPPEAIREAVINAIIHRDYTIYEGALNFAIYDDRIEIESYGKLLPGLKIEDLKNPHKSYLRNPRIANVFFRRGMIEQWGRGVQQIIGLCLQNGHPKPDFLEVPGGITVKLYSKNSMQTRLIINEQDENFILTTRQKDLLKLLQCSVTPLALREILELLVIKASKATIKRELEFLASIGLIGKHGKGRNIAWFTK